MSKIYFCLIGMLLIAVAVGCSPTPKENALTLVNAGAVESEMLERIRAYAQSQLRVPVRAIEDQSLAGQVDFQALEKSAGNVKSDADVTFIVLTGINKESEPLKVFEESGVAIVNVKPLYIDDSEKFGLRVERMVMRAAAFSFGLPPTPDPYCVTRNYNSLEDLDRMGRNYSPPWQARYAEEAAARGLVAPKIDVPDFPKAP
ncbi:MAG: hypothetical protein OEL75_03200 [Kiritimatiellaceae bacterium]|nr:hypothetical protein [Kiritimatiellaceae bacterium]